MLPSLSFVLPAYNEEANIEKTVQSILTYAKQKELPAFEVIVANDGSTDQTGEKLEALSQQYPEVKQVRHEVNRGYGAALVSGFSQATMDFVFLMDSDGQFDIHDLDRLIPHLEKYDFVLGYRAKRADHLIRWFNAWLYKMYIYLLLGVKVKDLDCAFKIFSRKVLESLGPLQSEGALISAELLAKAKSKGATMKEVPVQHFPRLYGDQSGANLKVILKMFKECWQQRKSLR